MRGRHRQGALLWRPLEGMRESGQTGLGLANLNYLGRLWGGRAVLSSLGPGSGMLSAGGILA